MRPEIWGPHVWHLLHTITLDYPINPTDNDKKNITNFVHALAYVLPCEKCRIHFIEHLNNNNLDDKTLSSKNNLIKWMIDIHNSVNKLNNKKILSYAEAYQEILKPYKKHNNYNNTLLITCVILVVLVVFGFFIYKKII